MGHGLAKVLFIPSRETISEVLVKINSTSFFLVSKVANGFRRTRDIFFITYALYLLVTVSFTVLVVEFQTSLLFLINEKNPPILQSIQSKR